MEADIFPGQRYSQLIQSTRAPHLFAFPYDLWKHKKKHSKAEPFQTWNSSVCFGKEESAALTALFVKPFERCTKNKSTMQKQSERWCKLGTLTLFVFSWPQVTFHTSGKRAGSVPVTERVETRQCHNTPGPFSSQTCC